MPDLAQALTAAPPVQWLIGRVKAITGDTITLTYRGGDVPDVGVLDQYVPHVGDVVHVLASDLNGFLAIGSNNQTIVPPFIPGADPPTMVTPTGEATYRLSTGTWVPDIAQAPDLVGCWFYSVADLTALTLALPMASLTIGVTTADDIPLEFVLHQTVSGSGSLVLVNGASYRVAAPPVGVPTEIRLPLEWANMLILGVASGVGVGGGDYTAALTGSSGLLTFTPL